jgi:hypothetical protein
MLARRAAERGIRAITLDPIGAALDEVFPLATDDPFAIADRDDR